MCKDSVYINDKQKICVELPVNPTRECIKALRPKRWRVSSSKRRAIRPLGEGNEFPFF